MSTVRAVRMPTPSAISPLGRRVASLHFSTRPAFFHSGAGNHRCPWPMSSESSARRSLITILICFKALCNPPPRFCPVPIRDIDQAGNPPDQSIFIAGQHAVGIGYLPQHLDDANTFLFGEILDHNPGEMKQICSLDRTFFRRFDETDYLAPFQAEA